ncbi:hypothetical protein [Methanocrinis sp.]|uniref:hypothetical protein n=1 Tax=Methanocrinis sp. TaxID=3101522 RepID=UPI003D14FCBC
MLLLSILIFSFVLGDSEGLCPRLRYADNVEWLGAGDLGFDLDVPEQNANEPVEPMASETEEESESKTDNHQSSNADGVDELEPGIAEGARIESGTENRVDLTLTGDVTGRVDLVIFRSGEIVFGTGSLTTGGVKGAVGVSGSIADHDLVLHMVPVDGSRLYVLDLEIEEGSIRGRYEAIGSDGRQLSGTADSSFFA